MKDTPAIVQVILAIVTLLLLTDVAPKVAGLLLLVLSLSTLLIAQRKKLI